MFKLSSEKISYFILILIFALVMWYFIALENINPYLNEYDPYYHVAAARFLKDYGPKYDFRWAQFTTFKTHFADKEYLLHALTLPFLYVTDDLIKAGKYTIIFLNVLFLLVYVYLLRRYIPPHLAGLFLILLTFSMHFSIYFTYLRPQTLGNIFYILAAYCAMNKRWPYVAIISIAYVLSHVSFPILVPMIFLIEVARFCYNREFCERNLYAVVLGIMAGIFIHPNYPNILLSVYLNAFLVPLYIFTKVPLDFGRELFPVTTDGIFIAEVFSFLSMAIVVVGGLRRGVKASFATFAWLIALSLYFLLALFGNRYWYPFSVVFYLFFASYLNDWRGKRSWPSVAVTLRRGLLAYFIVAVIMIVPNRNIVNNDISDYCAISSHYVAVGRFLKNHVPAGENIYHAYWSDSPFFICMNPKNNYISLLDPIYTFYPYPKIYLYYLGLRQGPVENPHLVIRDVFHARYGYAGFPSWLSKTAQADKDHFEVLYADSKGLVFKIIDKPPVLPAVKPKDIKNKPKKKKWFFF
jgi:hypothetical protein